MKSAIFLFVLPVNSNSDFRRTVNKIFFKNEGINLFCQECIRKEKEGGDNFEGHLKACKKDVQDKQRKRGQADGGVSGAFGAP